MVDSAIIEVEAGKGGDGYVSFHREKFRPKGGPDGGDGGKGGDVVIVPDAQLYSLAQFARLKKFKAQNGKNGGKNRCRGADGEDLILKAPLGTAVYRFISDRLVKKADFIHAGDRYSAAKGGQGGWGNIHFATPTHQTPREANPGRPGEKIKLKLELKSIADVGIIGKPNVGKSTLLKLISNSQPKIGDYPFTTTQPNLAVARFRSKKFIVADIPGLIEGASQGKGLGDKFLRHIERTKILIHLVSADSSDPERDYSLIRDELKAYNPKLTRKRELLVLSRSDLSPQKSQKLTNFIRLHQPAIISHLDKQSIAGVLSEIARLL